MDIIKVANLARLDLSDSEIEEFGSQLSHILEHIDKLDQIDVEGIEPTAHAAALFNVYRTDDIQAERILSREEVLGNAPATAHDQIKMPKVIE